MDWTVGNFEGSLLRVLVDVLVRWSMIIYVEPLLGNILVPGKGYVEGKIVGLLLWDKNGSPLDRYLGWNDDIGSWKDPGKILGSSEESMEGGMVGL